MRPDGSEKKVPSITYFTNLNTNNNLKPLPEFKKEEKYKKYDYKNKEFLYVNKIKQIPLDYDGYILVPVTILKYAFKDRFDIFYARFFCNGNFTRNTKDNNFFRIVIARKELHLPPVDFQIKEKIYELF